MRRLFLIAGGVATAAMLVISMRLNFLFGFALGQTAEKAWVFGCVSVVSDAWKGLGPILIIALLSSRRWPSALACSAIWIVCFLYSVSSALGVAIEDRSTRIGAREAMQLTYREAQQEIERFEQKRSGLRPHRAVEEIEAAIEANLARPVVHNQRVRGSVATLSDNCRKSDARTIVACEDIAKLREELAAAREEQELNHRLDALASRVRELRERGAMLSSDPQGELIARLSGGLLARNDIGPGLALLLAIMIELVSAFGPVVLASYAEVTGRVPHDTGRVVDYLAACVEPGVATDMLTANALYADYQAWTRRVHGDALSLADFVAAFDQVRADNRLHKIRKRKGYYCGLRLSSAAHVAPRRGRSRPDEPYRGAVE